MTSRNAGAKTLSAMIKTIGGRLGWIAISAATGMVTARTLGPAGRGALAAMIMWPVFLAGVLTFGLPSALIYCLRNEQAAKKTTLFSTATLLGTVIGVVASGIAMLIVPHWLHAYGPHVVLWSQCLLVFTTISVLMLIFRAALEAVGNFGASAATWLINPIEILVGLLILLLTHRLTELTAALCYVLAGVPILVWMFLRLRRELGWCLDGWRSASRHLLSYGLRSYGIDLCGTLAQSVDQALVVGMISAAEMGRYVVALSLSRILNSVYQAAAAVLFPKCIGLSQRRSLVLTVRMLVGASAVALPGAALIWIFGGHLLRLLYGPDYTTATLLLQLLTAEALLSGVSTLLGQHFMAMGRPGTITVLQATSLGATIPLLLVLVPRFGTAGAGAALLASSCLRLGLVLALYVRVAGRGLGRRKLQEFGAELVARKAGSFQALGAPAEPIQ